MKLENKVAVITGGARGLGLAYARRFVAEGARVFIGDLRDAEGSAAAVALGADVAHYRHCDVTAGSDVEALMDAAVDAFGGLDICVANAGVLSQQAFLEVTDEEFERVMDVNVTGVFLTGQAAARRMVALGRGGSIVNISSLAALLVNADRLAYAASKAAVNLLTKVMAVSLADHGIRVNAIGPGPTDSDMLDRIIAADPGFSDLMEARTALRRSARPEEMAGVAVFLASDESSYVTGQTLYVEGGRLPLGNTMPPRGGGAA